MDGQQLAWVLVVCTFFVCVMISAVVNAIVDRNSVKFVVPPEDAPPEIWIAYYKAVEATGTKETRNGLSV